MVMMSTLRDNLYLFRGRLTQLCVMIFTTLLILLVYRVLTDIAWMSRLANVVGCIPFSQINTDLCM